jgi:ribonucleoside-triphosphate reductase
MDRKGQSMKSSKNIVEGYLKKQDWRVKENSNSPYSYGGLGKHIIAEVSKDYWLREVYPEYISAEYLNGKMHIHDLGGLTLYCCGYSLPKLITTGVKGVPNIPTSSPAKHFDSILNQISNMVTVYQNEIMGAVAFSSVDTLLAPFIKKDELKYSEVKQSLQNFIFSINSNSRGGAEPAFSNITLDLTPPRDLLNEYAMIGDGLADFTYKDCQREMDMFNRAFCELMIAGDSNGRPFAYPIPTYNIHERFDWDNPNNKLLWEMAGKYGYPYFANFLNSDMKPEDARSMCCRLRLDLTELQKRNGGLFGSGDSTGSIGVVTINLPRIAYETKGNKENFFKELDRVLNIAKDSLEIKREWLQKNVIETRLIPAFDTYVGTMRNHFSTIGIVGMNEMCENFFGENNDILTDNGKQFCIEVGQHIRKRLLEFQQETGNLYNFEATPAESTAFRLAKKDKEEYPDIITRGTVKAPYYTNSCHIPVNKIKSIKETFDHQEDLQILFTGGTVIHIFTSGAISGETAKNIIDTVCHEYKVPYVSISPLNRYCPEHGYIADKVDKCPICNANLKMYQRITGYLRCVDNYNDGKKAEFYDRKQLSPEDD